MFLDGGRRELHLGRDVGDRLIIHPSPQQYGASQRWKLLKGGGEPRESLTVRSDLVRQRFSAGVGLRNGRPISDIAAKTVDEAVGRDPERQCVEARRLSLPRIMQQLRQAFLRHIFGDILGMTATPDIDQHRMSNRAPIRIRKVGMWSVTAGLCGGFDPKSYGGVILTHAARHRCGL